MRTPSLTEGTDVLREAPSSLKRIVLWARNLAGILLLLHVSDTPLIPPRSKPIRPSDHFRAAVPFENDVNLFEAIGKAVGCFDYIIYGDLKEELERLCLQHGLDPILAKAIIIAESTCDADAVSPAGALGVMQLMPQYHPVGQPFDPRSNMKVGIPKLAGLMRKYKNNINLVAGAYNAGEGRVDQCKCVPNIPETKTYVERVRSYYRILSTFR